MNASGSALLFAAGAATRLAGLRERWAKACVPVAGTTPLRFLLPRLRASGYAPLWLNLHHQAGQVRAQALELAPASALRFLAEPELLGTGGTLLEVASLQGALPRLAVNVKIFTDFDFAALDSAAPGTCVVHPASPISEFGGFECGADGLIRGLAGRTGAARGAAVFTGICVPHPAWLAALAAARAARPREPLCWIRDGMLPALAQGVPHRALAHPGAWCEVSTPERLARAAQALTRPALSDRAADGSDRAAR